MDFRATLPFQMVGDLFQPVIKQVLHLYKIKNPSGKRTDSLTIFKFKPLLLKRGVLLPTPLTQPPVPTWPPQPLQNHQHLHPLHNPPFSRFRHNLRRFHEWLSLFLSNARLPPLLAN